MKLGSSNSNVEANLMHPLRWIPADASSLLDVGCNTGELLQDCQKFFPHLRLAGVDVNREAIEAARKTDGINYHLTSGHQLPFENQSFDCVTCIEVIEHIPGQFRAPALAEIRRVLKPGGRLILRCPHAGAFGWLDAQNIRFQLPWLYRAVLGMGMRDAHYQEAKEEIVRHHHFTVDELLRIAGEGWRLETNRFGGFLLFPIVDFLCYPFYRKRRVDHPVFRGLQKVASLEMGINFGVLSYDVLLILEKT